MVTRKVRVGAASTLLEVPSANVPPVPVAPPVKVIEAGSAVTGSVSEVQV